MCFGFGRGGAKMKSGGEVSRGDSQSSQNMATAQTLARIYREHREINRTPSPNWCSNPINLEDPLEWHFTLKGPSDTAFEGGLYHGRIVLPKNYPFSPPSVMLLTQNGRFEVGKKICLSATNYHPELWQPAWGIRTLLDALCAFFPTPSKGALHSLERPERIRRQLALESVTWVCSVCAKSNRELVEESCPVPATVPLHTSKLSRKKSVDSGDSVAVSDNIEKAPVETHLDKGVEQQARENTETKLRNSESGVESATVAAEAISRRNPNTVRLRWSPILSPSSNSVDLLILVADITLVLLFTASMLLFIDLALVFPKFNFTMGSADLPV